MKVREVTHSEFISNMYGINAMPQKMKMDCVTTSVSIILGIPYDEVPYCPPVGAYDPDAGKLRVFITQEELDELLARYDYVDYANPWPYSSEVWLAWFEGNDIEFKVHDKRPDGISMACWKGHAFVSLGNDYYYNVGDGRMVHQDRLARRPIVYVTLKVRNKA